MKSNLLLLTSLLLILVALSCSSDDSNPEEVTETPGRTASYEGKRNGRVFSIVYNDDPFRLDGATTSLTSGNLNITFDTSKEGSDQVLIKKFSDLAIDDVLSIGTASSSAVNYTYTNSYNIEPFVGINGSITISQLEKVGNVTYIGGTITVNTVEPIQNSTMTITGTFKDIAVN